MPVTHVSAIQMHCVQDPAENLALAEQLVRQAAAEGGQILLLPELFERPYFCQERRYEYYAYATPVSENPAVQRLSKVAAELGVVLPVSFYEKEGTRLFNSIAMIDADGTVMGVYRKTHIPDDHYYHYTYIYCNTGFKVWDTRYGKVGVGICWDQWFPETRPLYGIEWGRICCFTPPPSAASRFLRWTAPDTGSVPCRDMPAANVVPVVAANRFGTETVTPCPENGGQSSSLCFYGTSFMTDATGAVLTQAPREGDMVLHAEYDFCSHPGGTAVLGALP